MIVSNCIHYAVQNNFSGCTTIVGILNHLLENQAVSVEHLKQAFTSCVIESMEKKTAIKVWLILRKKRKTNMVSANTIPSSQNFIV